MTTIHHNSPSKVFGNKNNSNLLGTFHNIEILKGIPCAWLCTYQAFELWNKRLIRRHNICMSMQVTAALVNKAMHSCAGNFLPLQILSLNKKEELKHFSCNIQALTNNSYRKENNNIHSSQEGSTQCNPPDKPVVYYLQGRHPDTLTEYLEN